MDYYISMIENISSTSRKPGRREWKPDKNYTRLEKVNTWRVERLSSWLVYTLCSQIVDRMEVLLKTLFI